ncbi:zinc finger FYVE domain-containing protein 9 [Cylas formicarius]|uniref:zinc finger FYVE domain-containing protein 9 n=1 Tax=Cylas formicarius TaxID=197179 RepID=UPI002958737F|nr:zinc finger FYVE domain-containing protein 9 [Cylas formicarius]XP_060533608.1 zinc finger FYVE domain-containing protein 9 [Cylas formicarius]
MDKYTIDLDQLLDDFEYSELTDQHSHREKSAHNSKNASQNSITKHSINTVFHSLNEYLSTNVSKGESVSSNSDNNNSENNLSASKDQKVTAEAVLESDDKIKTDRAVDVKDVDIWDASADPKCNGDNNYGNNSILKQDYITSKEMVTEYSALLPDEQYQDFSPKEEKLIDIDCELECSTETKNGAAESLEENVENLTLDLLEEKKDLVKLEYLQADVNITKQVVVDSNTKCDVNEEKEECGDLQEHQLDLLEEQLLEKKEKNIIVDKDVEDCEEFLKKEGEKLDNREGQCVLKEEQTQSNLQVEEEVEHVECFEDAKQDNNELDERDVCNIAKEEIKNVPDADIERNSADDLVIGFAKDVDVDENELAEMLEELEKEENELNENSSSTMEQEIMANESDAIVTNQHGNTEGTCKVERIEEMVKTEELNNTNEECKKEIVQRPQDLPLNNEKKRDQVRKIDLIGDPGSTPYNNVYVNKNMNKKETEANDSEGEYSSASPTFSDLSTDSTSTASTISVGDIESKQKDINAETLVEKGVAKLEHQLADDTEHKKPSTSGEPSESGQGDVKTSTVQASGSTTSFLDKSWLGREAPLWIPDSDASACLHCDTKFTMIKRRHHCRACGLVLCSKCCNLKFRLQYLDAEARVCQKCYAILNKDQSGINQDQDPVVEMENPLAFRPNPNNPLEYCSTVSPLQQAEQMSSNPPAVMVPVGVLKRKGSNKSKTNKSVMFCDGIAPGSDLTNLDNDFNYNQGRKGGAKNEGNEVKAPSPEKSNCETLKVDVQMRSFIPEDEKALPPTVSKSKTAVSYTDCLNSPGVVEMLKNETLTFAINPNLFVHVRIINMSCCINKEAWCFTTDGLVNVGNDEIVILLEFTKEEISVPKDLFFHIHNVYVDAVRGTSVKELGISLHDSGNFLGSKNHAGFVYIKPTFQCLENVIRPREPFLIGILIHRWETPWAKLFPLRLILRLGAEYRYYPSPIISTRHRDSVFVEIGHTIINLLADFRNFSYTLPQIRGLIIHMEDKNTRVIIPKNRYDQVMKSLSTAEDHILAFAGNFSPDADSHLVCIQDTQNNENSYATHAINIHNKPRKVTGASFIIFNGALKPSSGLTAKSNIVEDGLMIQVLPEHMAQIRDSLRAMKDHRIACGCVDAASDETVSIVWGENDVDFNVGVKSPVDEMAMGGIPSIRVHNGKDYPGTSGNRVMRWTEVFIIQNSEETSLNHDTVDISKLSESIAKASCTALVKYLDLLVSNNCQKIAIRVNLDTENVSYSAGSNGVKLPPIYMKSLDNELVPVLHRLTANGFGDNVIVLELIFRILNA